MKDKSEQKSCIFLRSLCGNLPGECISIQIENDLAVAYADVTDETEAQAKEARDGCPVDVIDLEALGDFQTGFCRPGRGKRWQNPV